MADLITLAAFKDYKNFISNKDDTKLSLIISSVSSFVKTYCSRTFIDYTSTSKIEYDSGADTSQIFLEETPIIAVSEVATSSDCGVTYTALATTEYYIDPEYNSLDSKDGTSFIKVRVDCPKISLKITYTGGYFTLPDDLRIACLDLVDYYREEQFTPKKGFEGASIENILTTMGQTTNLPSHILRILNEYRVVL